MANLFSIHARAHEPSSHEGDDSRAIERQIVDFDGGGDSETAVLDVLYGNSLPDPLAPVGIIDRLAA